MDCEEALQREDVTDTAKIHIRLAKTEKPILPMNVGKNKFLFAAGKEE